MTIHTTFRRVRLTVVALGATAAAAGCATTGATLGSGVGDAHLDRPPYYAGATPGTASIAYLPLAYQRGAGQSAIFDPKGGSGSAVDALLVEMNAYLDSLVRGPRVAASIAGVPPDVRFGCMMDASDECDRDAEGSVRSDRPRMRLAVGRPSQEWAISFASELQQVNAGAGLVLTLEVGQYWVRQRGLRADKEVHLGTGHVQHLPWLTSLDQPVQVLQLTGALVGSNGKAVRIGAEGLFARRTNIVMSGFGAQALISEEDVRQVRSMRRSDLAGSPLVWQAALRNLVAELTQRAELSMR